MSSLKDQENLFNPKIYVSKKGNVRKHNIENAMLFFDIVGFSKKMETETMMDQVGEMNQAIFDTLEKKHWWAEKEEDADKNDLILIPTGDGYGIAISNQLEDVEILEIAEIVSKALKKEGLKIRMGIARGRNVIAIDLNDNLNIFGYGVVLAARVCDLAAEGQILVHSTFADNLQEHKSKPELKKISRSFLAKHELSIECHNYFVKGSCGIPHEAAINTKKNLQLKKILKKKRYGK